MRALTQTEFLSLWEAGRSLHPLDRALLFIQAAFPEVGESVADWPLGRRNRALAELHCAAFGPALHGWTTCTQCREQLEFQMDGRALAESPSSEYEEHIVVGDRTYRLPTSRDLAAVAAEKDATVAALHLVQQCSLEDDLPAPTLNPEEIEAIGEVMAAADPLAEILMRFDCPSCGAFFDEGLELTSFLWEQVEVRARRLLFNVHQLASAYGWSESEILSLSPARREVYLQMVRA